jgi:esterase/lipase superfamily enzyme
MKKITLISLLIFVLNSCQNIGDTAILQKKLQPTWQKLFKNNYDDDAQIKVMIATNRLRKNVDFGCDDENFGVNFDKIITYGLCNIKVSKFHEIGNISSSKDNKDNKENDNFKIINSQNFSEIEFFNELKNNSITPLVFVHGFNVRYKEAIFRASQIAYDLKYQGPIILFTWPSGAKDGFFEEAMLNKTYELNAQNVKSSIDPFAKFLEGFKKNNIKINLMIHSMGHQLALEAINKISKNSSKEILINELFLNAPDYEAQAFKLIAKNIKKITNHITIYCSKNDKAMTASKIFNKNDRLGDCTNIDEVDVINVSAIDDSALGLGHGYYSSRSILNDMFLTLLGIDAKQRLFIVNSSKTQNEKYILRK